MLLYLARVQISVKKAGHCLSEAVWHRASSVAAFVEHIKRDERQRTRGDLETPPYFPLTETILNFLTLLLVDSGQPCVQWTSHERKQHLFNFLGQGQQCERFKLSYKLIFGPKSVIMVNRSLTSCCISVFYKWSVSVTFSSLVTCCRCSRKRSTCIYEVLSYRSLQLWNKPRHNRARETFRESKQNDLHIFLLAFPQGCQLSLG